MQRHACCPDPAPHGTLAEIEHPIESIALFGSMRVEIFWMAYYLITQSAQEVMRPENSPARNMCEFLEQTGQSALTSTISVYSQRGESAEQLRLYYMNDAALALWRKMGHLPEVRGTTKRPSRKSELCFGVPFSE